MATSWNGVYLTRVNVTRNVTSKSWVPIPDPGYGYEEIVYSDPYPPYPGFLPPASGYYVVTVGLVISNTYGFSEAYQVQEQTSQQTTTMTEFRTSTGVKILYYAWEVIPATSHNITSLPTPTYSYYNQVARITGTKSWQSTTNSSWHISVSAGNNPPFSSYLPPATNYNEGWIGRVVAPAEYGGTAYYIVSQYTYYRCVVK